MHFYTQYCMHHASRVQSAKKTRRGASKILITCHNLCVTIFPPRPDILDVHCLRRPSVRSLPPRSGHTLRLFAEAINVATSLSDSDLYHHLATRRLHYLQSPSFR
jgi:hypothetical protein